MKKCKERNKQKKKKKSRKGKNKEEKTAQGEKKIISNYHGIVVVEVTYIPRTVIGT